MSDLAVDRRSGLPDELAFLRSLYLPEAWRRHPNFGELSDFWLHVHESLRQKGKFLQQATADYLEGRSDPNTFRRTFAPNLNHFLQHLNGHHQIEDRVYFPKFRSLDQRMAAGFDLLDKDHATIHEALIASAHGANRFLAAFGAGEADLRSAAEGYAAKGDRLLALLLRHLGDEEDLVIPAMLHYGERRVS